MHNKLFNKDKIQLAFAPSSLILANYILPINRALAFLGRIWDMEINERREFYEKLYFHELEVREKLEVRLKLPMTAFSVLTAVALFLFNDIVKENSQQLSCLFIFFYMVGCVALIISIIFFIRSWYGYTYKMLPNAIVLENYYQETREHYSNIDSQQSTQWTNEAYDQYLLETFRDYAAFNTVNNDRKAYKLYQCNTSMLISLFLLLLAFYPYFSRLNFP